MESFNYLLEEGLADCAKNIYPVEFEMPDGDRVKLFVESISIAPPQVPITSIGIRTKKIYPSECRQRASTYSGACTVSVGWAVNGAPRAPIDKNMGDIPIMLKVSTVNIITSCYRLFHEKNIVKILFFNFYSQMFVI